MLKKINLIGKTALVTGAGKGLGKACAIALAEAGAKVLILSRTRKDLIKVNKIIEKGDPYQVQVEKTAEAIAKKTKLVKNAQRT